MNEELQRIISEMEAAGESRDAITQAVQVYQNQNSEVETEPTAEEKAEKERKATAKSYISSAIDNYATGFFAEEKLQPQLQKILGAIDPSWNVAQDISEGSTGSGDAMSLNNITLTNPNGVKRSFNMSNRDTMKEEISSFMIENPKQSASKVKQEENLKEELATAFNDNPSLYGEMLDPSKMTLSDRRAYESDPTEYLRERVRNHVGGFGWFGFGGERAEEYNELGNADINEIVDDVFNLNLEQELTNRRAALRDNSDEATHVENGGTSRDWHDKDRAGAISTYSGRNLEMAEIVEDLNHGGLNEADWKATHEKYKVLKEKMGKTYGVIDLSTGQQILTDDLIQARELAEKLGPQASVLDTDSAETQYEGLDIDDLQLQYERSVLELSGFNNEIKNTMLEFDNKDALGYDFDYTDDAILKPMSIADYMKQMWGYGGMQGAMNNPVNYIPKGFTEDEWKARLANYRQQQIDFTTDNAALQRMYLLNEGIMDEDMSVLDVVQTAGKSFLTPFVGESGSQKVFGSTHAEELDRLSGGYDMAGFEKTEEEISWAERSTGEQVNEGIFGTGKLLLELAGTGKFLKAAEGAIGLDAIATWANASRYKNLATGATYTTAKLKKRADAVGLTVADYARKFKLAETGVGLKQLGVGTAYAAIHEGIVFEGVTRYDTDGKESGLVGGATFGAVGNLTRMIAPALVRKGRLKDFDRKGLGKPGSRLEKNTRMRVNTQKMFELGMQPTNFIVAMEMAETMDALYDDAVGNKEFSTFMDEHYGDYGDVMQRFIVNGWMGLALGQANSNGVIARGFVDYKSKAGIKETQNFAKEKLEQLAGDVGVKPNEIYVEKTADSGETYMELNPKLYDAATGLSKSGGKKSDLSQFEKHLDVYRDMEVRYMQAMRAEGYMNPLRAQETITRDMKPIIAENAKNGIETRVEIVDNNNLKPGQKGLENKNAEVVLDGKVKTYRFNIERYTPGVQAHEVGHDFFDQRFGSDAMFTGEFYEKLSNLGNKIELGKKVTEAEANKLGLNWEVVKNKNLTLTQALELKDFGVSDPVQQQKIRHWEMFSHLAERMGSFENYQKLSDAYAFESLGEMINSFGNKMGQKYDLTTEKDIVEWFRDYGQTLGKKRSPAEMFEHLDNFVHYGTKEGETAIKDAEAKSEGRTSSKSDTYSSERLDVGADIKINDPKVLAAKIQQEYEDKIASAESKEAAFRDLMDPGRRSPHYDTRYPVVGNKIGPLLDIAINSYNKTIPERYRIDLKNRSFDSERTEFVTDIAYADKRGLPDILAKYKPINPETGKPQKLATWIVGQVRLRSQEIKGRGIDRRSESRAAEKEGVVISGTDISEINKMFEDVGAGEGKIDRGESVKEGIRLNDFSWKRGEVEGVIPPSSIEAIRVSAKNTFKDMPIEKLDSYMNVTTGMHSEVRPEIDALFGFVEGAKPKENAAAGNKFIKDNGAMLYDAMHLTSNPEFYENTNAAKTIFRDFYKDTGVKYKTTELSTQEAARTNARANKFEKLPATAEVVDKFIETATTGRDAGTILKKHATYKDMLSQVWGGQNFRDIVDIKTEVGRDFIENEVPNIKDGARKIEVLKAELALRKLKGATPETLASDMLDVKNDIMELYREVDFSKELFPGFHFKRIVESDSRFKDFFDKIGGVDRFIKEDMGYDLTDVGLKTWAKYAEATRQLNLQESSKVVIPETFSGWGEVSKKLQAEFSELNIDGRLNVGERGWSGNKKSVKEFDAFLSDFYNTLNIEVANSSAMLNATGAGNTKFFGERRDATWTSDFAGRLKGSGEKPPSFLKHFRVVTNGVFKNHVNKSLDLPEFKDVKSNNDTKLKMAERLKKYVTRKGSTYEQTEKANQEFHEYVYSKLFDYYKGSGDKTLALNNIFRFLQQQTNLGTGFSRGLATHDAVSLKKGAKHSEHDFQLLGMNGNFMLEMVRNAGNKSRFQDTFKGLSKKYKQSIIDKSIQEKYDSPEFGGKTEFDFEFSTESGKYMWLREKALASTTLDLATGKTYDQLMSDVIGGAKGLRTLENVSGDMLKKTVYASENLSGPERLEAMKAIDKALANGRKRNAKRKGMSTWDFDDTLAHTKSDVLYTTPEGKKGKLNAEQFAEKGAELLEQGYEFDFSEFNKVTGGEPGPFLEKALERAKKFGTKDQFVLTARAPESAPAIYEFLKSQGLNIPLKNITGLGNSTGEAKAQWMLEKFAEGYNDMYFADDAMQNVKAVRDVLSQLDIKSDVQQARRLASDNLDVGINEMIERRSGIGAVKEFSAAKARMLGKKRFSKSLVVPGAQDFMGLMQNFMGKGKQGNADRAFFEKNLVDPFARATKEMNEARQKSSEDMKRLYKDIPSVKRKINKTLENSAFTYDQAIRNYLWTKAGLEVPGLSAKDSKLMNDVVSKDAELLAFADGLQAIAKGEYVAPSQNWIAETIVSDLFNLNNRANRSKYLAEWIENKNIIFSEANMNKIEATQGTKFREALEDVLYRIETGSNRPTGSNRLANAHMNFINGSVGATMFLNMRSAMLQTISATNYINWAENNPLKAAQAFGNQKQYWKDFSMIWNSPMLKQRRAGLEYNVQEAELAAAVAGQKNKAKAALAWLIKKGFTPTQAADSFAIAAGGSTYYRNRVKMYEKQGLSKAEAKDKAFLDFQEITETSQQSSRADLISQQQASSLGRTVLAWANTPMQYMRIQEKAARDIANGRGDFKSNVSKIAYYGAIQSIIFASLQNALFSFGLDEEENLDDADFAKRTDRIIQTVIDGQLRGMGVGGAAMSAVKNTILEFQKQELKADDGNWYSKPDHTKTILQLTSYSPVIGSKLRKLYSASQTWNYNRDAVQEMGLDISNPALEASANVVEATTNVPIARIVRKINNLKEVADSENQNWQRVASLMGYSAWDLGIENTEVKDAKDRGRQKKKDAEGKALEDQFKKDQRKERDQGKETTCAGATRSGGRCSNKPIGNTAYCTVHQKVDKRADGKKTQCTHVKKDGKRCKMKTTNKSGKCYYHD